MVSVSEGPPDRTRTSQKLSFLGESIPTAVTIRPVRGESDH